MSRKARVFQDNLVFHIYNRRTDKQRLFSSADAYEDFLRIIERAKCRFSLRVHAYILMSTHWHLAVSAESAKILSPCFKWVGTTHAVRFRLQTETRGQGHVYQDRFAAVGVEDAVSYARLVKYIESNPVSAGLVQRAEEYRWSSLHERL